MKKRLLAISFFLGACLTINSFGIKDNSIQRDYTVHATSTDSASWKTLNSGTTAIWNKYLIEDAPTDISYLGDYELILTKANKLTIIKEGTSKALALNSDCINAKILKSGSSLFVGPCEETTADGAKSHYIKKIDLASGTVTNYNRLEDYPNLREDPTASTFTAYVDSSGNCWYAQNGKYITVYRISPSTGKNTSYMYYSTYYTNAKFVGEYSGEIYLSRDNLISGTAITEIMKIKPDLSGTNISLSHSASDIKLSSDGTIWALTSDKLSHLSNAGPLLGDFNLTDGKAITLDTANNPWVIDINLVKTVSNGSLATVYTINGTYSGQNYLAAKDISNFTTADFSNLQLMKDGVDENISIRSWVYDNSQFYKDAGDNGVFCSISPVGTKYLTWINADGILYKTQPCNIESIYDHYLTKLYNNKLIYVDGKKICTLDSNNNSTIIKQLPDSISEPDILTLDSKGNIFVVSRWSTGDFSRISPDSTTSSGNCNSVYDELGHGDNVVFYGVKPDKYDNVYMMFYKSEQNGGTIYIYEYHDLTTPRKINVSSMGLGKISNEFFNEDNELEVVVPFADGTSKIYKVGQDLSLSEDTQREGDPVFLTTDKIVKGPDGTLFCINYPPDEDASIYKKSPGESRFVISFPIGDNYVHDITALPSGFVILSGGLPETSKNFMIYDTKATAVVSSSPAASSKSISTNADIVISFNKFIFAVPEKDKSLLADVSTNGTSVPFEFKYNGKDFTITPSTFLKPNTTYSVTIKQGGLRDWVGNVLAQDYTFSFTTGSGLIGDVNGDGQVTITDIGLIAQNYNKDNTSGSWSTIQKYDINSDNIIDIYDLVTASKNMT
ncbi:MAG: Ig-like domain-containing protein [Bacillota bacterium]|nr:Ig-like domain-containing protein [Bacillota bacterium]